MKRFFKKFKKNLNPEFYEVEVIQEKFPTPQSKLLSLRLPEGLKEDFQWEAGQYLSLQIFIEGEWHSRDYSLCNLSGAAVAEICVKETPNGFVSKYLVSESQLGRKIRVSLPKGKFVLPLKPNEKRVILGFAAGSGITPIYSILQDVLFNEPQAQFHLFYGNKKPETVIFLSELEALQRKFPEHFFLHTLYSQFPSENPLLEGRMNSEKLDLWINQILEWDEVDEVLICGPNEMAVDLRKACVERGMHPSQVHMELFTPIATKQSEKEKSEQSEVVVIAKYGGVKKEAIWSDFSTSLLDTLLDQDIDVPYSCKGGVCGTCVCKIDGEAKMNEQLVLLDSEIEEGRFLPCVSYQAKGEISLDFDIM